MNKKLCWLLFAAALSLSVSAQKIGSKIKILEDGTWMNGTLLSIKNGQYFVHFDNRPDNYDKLVKENEIVFVDGDDRKPIRDNDYRPKHDTVYITRILHDTIYVIRNGNDNRNGNDFRNNDNRNGNDHNFQNNEDENRYRQNFWRKGDRVEVMWASEWFPATITDMRDGKYKISYDGYINIWDEWVSGDKIRRR